MCEQFFRVGHCREGCSLNRLTTASQERVSEERTPTVNGVERASGWYGTAGLRPEKICIPPQTHDPVMSFKAIIVVSETPSSFVATTTIHSNGETRCFTYSPRHFLARSPCSWPPLVSRSTCCSRSRPRSAGA